MTIFVVVMFIMMLTVAGMATDFMRHEAMRADLQNALDRGVLAATDLRQDVRTDDEAKAIVQDYMATRGFGSTDYTLDVAVQNFPAGRNVTASAQMEMGTIFLRGTNLDQMSVPASSAAEQAFGKLEVVLVLDVSNSMRRQSVADPTRTKFALLKEAAKDFIDEVLTADTKDRTLVSVVPYSSQVAWPANVADAYNLNRRHNQSSCFEFSELDFTTTTFHPTGSKAQVQHFIEALPGDYGSGLQYTRTVRGCPHANNAVTFFSNNAGELKSAIDGMISEKWTASYMGMKYAAALVDPSSRPLMNAFVDSGVIEQQFRDWPLDYNAGSSKKVIVLMSDGVNTRLNRIYNSRYNNRSLNWWHWNRPFGSDVQRVVDNLGQPNYPGDTLLNQICSAAKANSSVTIYTIGFELGYSAQGQLALANCASDPGSAFFVQGVDITTAFGNIASELDTLRLVR